MSRSEIDSFEQALIEDAPRPLVIVGSALSPDGHYGVALTLLPTANDYLLDDLLVRTSEGWEGYTGGSGGGIQWTSLGSEDVGVLRFSGEAPAGATVARIAYEGETHPTPIRHGHFFFVVWDTPYREEPVLLGFE